MVMRKSRLQITGLLLSGLIIVLAGCGTVKTYPSKARELPDTVGTKLSVGDTRQKVRTLLGEPLIVNKSLGLEVYRLTARDIDVDMVLLPIPIPSPSPYKVTAGALILYDEVDKIKDIAVDAMTEDYYDARETQLQFCSFRISAGGYRFVNTSASGCDEPHTLIGPSISRDELSQKKPPAGKCSLVLLMNECPMEIVSLDNMQIADLSPAGAECGGFDSTENYHFWTFIQKNISPGAHSLVVRQRTRIKDHDFKANFECKSGETIYAELDVDVEYKPVYVFGVKWGSEKYIDGELSVSNSPPQNHITSKSVLSPILWHKEKWYGPPTIPSREDHYR